VQRFVAVLREYRINCVCGDRYAGDTFACDFQSAGVSYLASERSKSELYEALEPLLNAHAVVLLDVPVLEQQLLGLVWRGGKIDHQSGEHDDWANAVVGSLVTAATGAHSEDRAVGPRGQRGGGLAHDQRSERLRQQHQWV
jgi:hypothetical protein